MIAFIDEYRDRFSVEFICTTLNKQRQGGFITSRGYRNAKYGTPSARSIRDRELVAAIRRYTQRTMVCTGFGKCGTRSPAVGSRSAASRPRGSCAWQECRARARDVPRSRHIKPEEKIPGQIWSIANSGLLGRIGCGSRTLLMFALAPGSCIRRL